MENKKQLKEAIQKALMSVLEKKRLHDMKEEEDEVLIEPFMLLEPENMEEVVANFTEELTDEELHEFMNLSDVLEQGEVDLSEEEIKELKDVADGIVPIDSEFLECDVLGEQRFLINNVDCNMKKVPLLGVTLITPVNLIVEKVVLDSDMRDEGDIEVTVMLETEKFRITYSLTLNKLISNGLLVTVPMNVELLEMSPFEFRGMTKLVDRYEMQRIINS